MLISHRTTVRPLFESKSVFIVISTFHESLSKRCLEWQSGRRLTAGGLWMEFLEDYHLWRMKGSSLIGRARTDFFVDPFPPDTEYLY